MVSFLSQLPKLVAKKKKRVGRGLGSGRGSKSGRGTTRHQKAREKIPLHFEGGQGRMIKKFPLMRGKGKNKPRQNKPLIITLSQLDQFNSGETVTKASLIQKGLIDISNKKVAVKVLDNGKLTKKLTVQLPTSKAAKSAIEKLGGRVIMQ